MILQCPHRWYDERSENEVGENVNEIFRRTVGRLPGLLQIDDLKLYGGYDENYRNMSILLK